MPSLTKIGGAVRVHPDLTGLLTDDLDAIGPHPSNPRNGDTDAIGESIRANGLYRPIYAQRSTGHILAGNHTYAAALELGATKLPVVWLDVDDTTALRILLADNRTADVGRYDDALLLDTIGQLAAADTLVGTGWNEAAMLDLMGTVENYSDTATGFLSGLGDTGAHDGEAPIIGTNAEGVVFYQLSYTVTKDDRDTVRAAIEKTRGQISDESNRATAAAALVAMARGVLDE